MRNAMRKNNHRIPTLAIAFFVVMTFGATLVSHAQENNSLISSPLVTTTGANVLGSGHLMLSGDLNAYYLHSVWDGTDFNNYSIMESNAGLRWGIGNRAELTLGLTAEHAHGKVFDTLNWMIK